MHVNHTIHMDLLGAEPIPTLDMMQYDQLSRQVDMALFCGQEAFQIPQDAGVLIHYVRGNGESGVYDSMSDGTRAWSISGNRLTIAIAPEVLLYEGTAAVSARLTLGTRTLNTFTFLIQIHKGMPSGQVSGSHKLCWYLSAPPVAAQGQLLAVASVDENGVITEVTAIDSPKFDTSFGIWGEVYAQKLRVTGRFSTDSKITVTFNGNRLQSVGEPTADTDAATKAYVDKAIADAISML